MFPCVVRTIVINFFIFFIKIMVRLNSFLAVATMLVTLVFTSCQDNADDLYDGAGVSLEETEVACEDIDALMARLNASNDSTVFDYTNAGPLSSQFEVADPEHIDIFYQPSTQARTRSVVAGGMLVALLKWGGEKAAVAGLSYGGEFVTKKIAKAVGVDMDPQATALEDMSKNMSEIKNTLGEMEKKMDGISKQITDQSERALNGEMTTLFRERNKSFNSLSTNTCRRFINFSALLTKGDEEGALKEAEQWVNGICNGETGCQALLNYIDFVTGKSNTNTKGFNMPQVYDYWIYQTTPWEHEGYAKREAIRMADATTVLAGTMMAKAYFDSSNESAKDYMMQQIDEHYKLFTEVYEKNIVHHHDSLLICQIRDAHIVFNKEITTFNPEDQVNKTRGLLTENRLRKALNVQEDEMKHYLKQPEFEAICKYYGFANLRQLEDKLQEVGFNMGTLAQGKAHMMNLDGNIVFDNLPNSPYLNFGDYLTSIYRVVSYQLTKVVSDAENDLNPMPMLMGIGKAELMRATDRKTGERVSVWYYAPSYRGNYNSEFYRPVIKKRYTGMYPLGN